LLLEQRRVIKEAEAKKSAVLRAAPRSLASFQEALQASGKKGERVIQEPEGPPPTFVAPNSRKGWAAQRGPHPPPNPPPPAVPHKARPCSDKMKPGVAKPSGPQEMQKMILQLTAKNRSIAGTEAERASARKSLRFLPSAGLLQPASKCPPPKSKSHRTKREERHEAPVSSNQVSRGWLNSFGTPDPDDEWGDVMSRPSHHGADDKNQHSLTGARTNVEGDPGRR
jgi:hypothetical protein